jgi:hypothetical protein
MHKIVLYTKSYSGDLERLKVSIDSIKQQYIDFKNQGYTENNFKQNYLGIVMQSNWNAPLKY